MDFHMTFQKAFSIKLFLLIFFLYPVILTSTSFNPSCFIILLFSFIPTSISRLPQIASYHAILLICNPHFVTLFTTPRNWK